MKKIILPLILFIIFSNITGCVNIKTKIVEHTDSLQWDFDHQVQFVQTTLEEHYYQLEIISNNKANFERLATFLLRQSYSLCGDYHYKIEIIQGIEGFDDKRAMPNYIFPSLMAKVQCKPKLNKDKN